MRDFVLGCNDRLYQACVWVAGLSIAVMALIIPWGIFTRYVLGTGSQWPEPVAILLMVLFTFVGASAGYRAGAHIAVAMVTQRLPARLQKFLEVAMTLLMGAVALFMVVYGISLCRETWGQTLAEIPALRVGIAYLPVPLSGFVTLLFVLEHLFFGSQAGRAAVQADAHLD
jgi:TRAP-type C4-dicarboxylate transport system permease small subunit